MGDLLRQLSTDGKWGGYIALLGQVNMLDIPVAVVLINIRKRKVEKS